MKQLFIRTFLSLALVISFCLYSTNPQESVAQENNTNKELPPEMLAALEEECAQMSGEYEKIQNLPQEVLDKIRAFIKQEATEMAKRADEKAIGKKLLLAKQECAAKNENCSEKLQAAYLDWIDQIKQRAIIAQARITSAYQKAVIMYSEEDEALETRNRIQQMVDKLIENAETN